MFKMKLLLEKLEETIETNDLLSEQVKSLNEKIDSLTNSLDKNQTYSTDTTVIVNVEWVNL